MRWGMAGTSGSGKRALTISDIVPAGGASSWWCTKSAACRSRRASSTFLQRREGCVFSDMRHMLQVVVSTWPLLSVWGCYRYLQHRSCNKVMLPVEADRRDIVRSAVVDSASLAQHVFWCFSGQE